MTLTTPVLFGEILFDCFQDGRRVLGGAPLNVALHLQRFGVPPRMISRVGEDDAGREVRAYLSRESLDLAGVQTDPARPTGRVEVTVEAGQPSYEIVPDQAYDAIDAGTARDSVARKQPFVLCHGTLIARSPQSRETLQAVRDAGPEAVFVDVNLREPWWDPATALKWGRGVEWLKLNEDELFLLLQRPAADSDEALEAGGWALLDHTEARHLLLTRGSEGAWLFSAADRRLLREPPPPIPTAVVDTVGAGDAMTAVALLGMLEGWSLPAILRRGVAFAGRLCTIRGAVPGDAAWHREARTRWNDEGEEGGENHGHHTEEGA